MDTRPHHLAEPDQPYPDRAHPDQPPRGAAPGPSGPVVPGLAGLDARDISAWFNFGPSFSSWSPGPRQRSLGELDFLVPSFSLRTTG